MLTPRTLQLIDLALEEDAGLGDLTSRAIFPQKHRSRAVIDAKQDLVVCGVEVAAAVFARVDPALKVRLLAADGDKLKRSAAVLRVEGPTVSLLTAERTALNFMQRLSGIATQARRYADAVRGTGGGLTASVGAFDTFGHFDVMDGPATVQAFLRNGSGGDATARNLHLVAVPLSTIVVLEP